MTTLRIAVEEQLPRQIQIIRDRHQAHVVYERGWFWSICGCGTRSFPCHSEAAAKADICRMASAEMDDATAKDYFAQLVDLSVDVAIR